MKKTICIALCLFTALALPSCTDKAAPAAPAAEQTSLPEETEKPNIYYPTETVPEETTTETSEETSAAAQETTLPLPDSVTVADSDIPTEYVNEETRRFPEEAPTFSEEGIPVENAYYSLRLPASWNEKYVKDVSFGEQDMLITNFREKTSAEAGAGGKLFSLVLAPGTASFTAPLYRQLRQIRAFDGYYTLYIEYPTDQQYTVQTKTAYDELAGDIDAVLDTLMAGEGCIFE